MSMRARRSENNNEGGIELVALSSSSGSVGLRGSRENKLNKEDDEEGSLVGLEELWSEEEEDQHLPESPSLSSRAQNNHFDNNFDNNNLSASSGSLPILLPSLHKERLKAMESLDYATHDCLIYREALRKNTKWSNTMSVGGHWLLTVMIGCLVGLTAFLVKQAILVLNDYKFQFTDYLMRSSNMGWSVLLSLLVYTLISVLYAVIACATVFIFGSPAGGSGIPEVMGYLNGVRVEHTINIKTFLGKVISIIFAFSSGLALGPEGPMIHIGSMLGGGLGQSKDKAVGLFPSFMLIQKYRNDRDQRDFISSGAAAGVAAAFGAPVGGLLFSIEEASSFWSHSLTWRTFFCCMIAAFTVNVTMMGLTEIKDTGMLKLGLSGEHLYHYMEIVPFILIGIIGGLIGALFIRLNTRLTGWRRTHIQSKFRKVLEVAAIATFTCLVSFIVSYFWQCRSEKSFSFVDGSSSARPLELPRFYCPQGYYNEMAAMVFERPEHALRNLFSRTQKLFSLWALAFFTLLYFSLSVVTCGLTLAGGLFIPMMVAGAGIGRFVGELVYLMDWDIPVDPSIYALIGAAAVMTGFCRLTLSLVVIMVELTENTQYLLPIILCVMVAKWSADLFGESLYVSQMDMKGIPYLPSTPSVTVQNLSVQDVMSPDPVVLRCMEKIENIVQVLQGNEHNGFPVVTNRWDASFAGGVGPIRSSSLDARLLRALSSSRPRALSSIATRSPPPLSIARVESVDSLRHEDTDGSEGKRQERFQGFILRKHLLVILAHVVKQQHIKRTNTPASSHSVREQTTKGKEKEVNAEEHQEETEEPVTPEKPAEKEEQGKKEGSRQEDDVEAGMAESTLDFDDFERAATPLLEDVIAQLDDTLRPMYIDLRPYINLSAATVLNTWSFTETYSLFRTLGIRHITVLDDKSRVVGIVTRYDLL